MSQAKALRFMHSIAPRCRNALATATATATWYRRTLGVRWPCGAPAPQCRIVLSPRCLEARSTVYMWRLAKHSRETVPTGVHTPGAAAILKQSTLDARHGTTAPCRVRRHLQGACNCLSVYGHGNPHLCILCLHSPPCGNLLLACLHGSMQSPWLSARIDNPRLPKGPRHRPAYQRWTLSPARLTHMPQNTISGGIHTCQSACPS
jgi:hypothetical protein